MPESVRAVVPQSVGQRAGDRGRDQHGQRESGHERPGPAWIQSHPLLQQERGQEYDDILGNEVEQRSGVADGKQPVVEEA